ncbi:MAG: hypothetical protein K2N28_04675, partial [Muribaculaceae bacterium]|nr:hypothetical protein [Muribaculaceae bacterium]
YMATYKGKPAVIDRPIGDVYARFSDLSAMEEVVKNRAGDLAEKAEIKFEADSLTIVNNQVGEIRFEVTERVEPSKVVFKAANSPLPIVMAINLAPVGETSTEVSTTIDVEIPVMLKAFIGPKLQQVADQFGTMMAGMGS